MKKYMLSTLIILMFLACQLRAQTQGEKPNNDDHYPWVPRVSAYEAYSKYKNGQALIFHAGGAQFTDNHIVGAINIDFKPREKFIARLPKKGIELFLYCYWTGEEASAGLADEMIKMGFTNVKTVDGGGKAMERYFEYYAAGMYEAKITNPLTGKVTIIPLRGNK